MTIVELASVLIFSCIALVWLGLTIAGVFSLALVPRLRTHRPHPSPPSVTVVIAARDEAQRIGQTIDHLLAIQSPSLRIVIVDDRSEDATASIVQTKAESEPRIELRQIHDLPDGWLGKPHALHHGTSAIETEWILFSDADTWISQDTISRAFAAAESSNRPIDHVAVLPGYDATGILGAAGTLSTYTHFLIRCAVTNLGLQWLPVGVGAFNLVRTDAYRAIGGHQSLRYEVVDDVKLGLLLQREGRHHGRGHSLILSSPESVRIDWKADVRTLTALIEKNFFAMTRFSPLLASCFVTAGWLCLIGAATGLTIGSIGWGIPAPVRLAGLIAGLCWLTSGLPMVLIARQSRWPPLAGLLSPLMAWVAPVALYRSARSTLRRGGVLWRGRLYPLEDLRRGQVW